MLSVMSGCLAEDPAFVDTDRPTSHAGSDDGSSTGDMTDDTLDLPSGSTDAVGSGGGAADSANTDDTGSEDESEAETRASETTGLGSATATESSETTGVADTTDTTADTDTDTGSTSESTSSGDTTDAESTDTSSDSGDTGSNDSSSEATTDIADTSTDSSSEGDVICERSLCGELNAGAAIDDSVWTNYMLFGLRMTMPVTDLTLIGAEIYTGEAIGSTQLSIWSDDRGEPDRRIGRYRWTMSPQNSWQGGDFDGTLDITGDEIFWLVWDPVDRAQAPVARSGMPTEHHESIDGGNNWMKSPQRVPWRVRLYCQPNPCTP